MKVKQLIELLEHEDPEALVITWSGTDTPASYVEQILHVYVRVSPLSEPTSTPHEGQIPAIMLD